MPELTLPASGISAAQSGGVSTSARKASSVSGESSGTSMTTSSCTLRTTGMACSSSRTMAAARTSRAAPCTTFLDQGAKPCPAIGPGAAAVVLEQNIGRGVLELGRDQARLRIGDGATARQCEIECFIPVGRRDRAGLVFAAGADGYARGRRQRAPELDCLWMCLSPCSDIGIDFAVGAFVLRHQPAPRSDRAAEAAGEVSAFADLAFRRGDLGERVILAQHLARDHAVRL